MGASSEVFLKMSEEHYLTIPSEVREVFLRDKRIDSENSDWNENIKDPLFDSLYKKSKEAKKKLEQRQFDLREMRRNIK